MLLLHDLGMQFAHDGEPAHVLTRPQDFPLLDLHAWLLDDWAAPDSVERSAFEADVFVAAYFEFLAVSVKAARHDAHSLVGDEYRPLGDDLERQAMLHWRKAVGDNSTFWAQRELAYQTAAPTADARAALACSHPLAATGYLALASLPVLATAAWAGRQPELPELLNFTEQCRAVLQAVGQLASLRRDLGDGIVTYPVQRALAAMGLTASASPSFETALGALLLTGALDKALQGNEARIATARSIAGRMSLPRLQAWSSELEALNRGVRELFGLRPEKRESKACAPKLALLLPAPLGLDHVLRKAQAYLLEDPSFREAWDVQRYALATAPCFVGQTFQASLVIDILARHGHRLVDAADDTLRRYQDNRYRYWERADLLVPDADSLALALRLVPLSSNPGWACKGLEVPLQWMRASQAPCGHIPVWFRDHDCPPALSDLVVLYGTGCATVETNLMLSLIGFDWDRYRDLIEACARHWCGRWLAVGLGATEHYTPLYSLWAATELVARLSERTHDEALRGLLSRVGDVLAERLLREGEQAEVSPQEAAFLTLASLRTHALPFKPAWVTAMTKHQRHDGCWGGEGIYITTAARGLVVNWLKSRVITTAFVYDALMHYQAHLQAS